MWKRALRQPVSVDVAPKGSKCVQCGKPATINLVILGGSDAQEGGSFCQCCGVDFICVVADSLERVIPAGEAIPAEA